MEVAGGQGVLVVMAETLGSPEKLLETGLQSRLRQAVAAVAGLLLVENLGLHTSALKCKHIAAFVGHWATQEIAHRAHHIYRENAPVHIPSMCIGPFPAVFLESNYRGMGMAKDVQTLLLVLLIHGTREEMVGFSGTASIAIFCTLIEKTGESSTGQQLTQIGEGLCCVQIPDYFARLLMETQTEVVFQINTKAALKAAVVEVLAIMAAAAAARVAIMRVVVVAAAVPLM